MAQAWHGRSGESAQRHFHEEAWWLVPTQIWLASFFGSLCRWETVWWTYSLRSSLARPPSPILCWETILSWYTDTVPLWWVPRAPKESSGATHSQGSALERHRSFILLRCSSENTRRFSEMSCVISVQWEAPENFAFEGAGRISFHRGLASPRSVNGSIA